MNIKRRELQAQMNRWNRKYTAISAVICILIALVLYFIYFINDIAQTDNNIVRVTLLTLILLQILYLLGYLILLCTGRMIRSTFPYLVYDCLTIIVMTIVFYEMSYCYGLWLLFGFSGLFLIFIPLYEKRIRYDLYLLQTVMIVIMCILLPDRRCKMFMMCGFMILSMLVSNYEQNQKVRMFLMSHKLKRKTISAEHDALTGLLNRRGMEIKTANNWNYCRRSHIPVSIMELDIDYFKKYNDSFGHPQGDRCLQVIAEAIYNTAYHVTDIITRTGGEEFMIYTQGLEQEELITLALRIKKNVARLGIEQAYHTVSSNVTLSIGIAIGVPSESLNFDQLYEKADHELYLAKKYGRNCIVCGDKLYGGFHRRTAKTLVE